MRIWNLQALLVCRIIIWETSLVKVQWISGWRSWLASRIQSCVWCLAFFHHMRWCMFWHIRNPWIGFLRIRCWRRRGWICKNISRYTMRVPKYLAAYRCGSAFPLNGWAFRQDFERWENTSWLATWYCPLRTDSASLTSLESFIQLVSFCTSWILPVISRIVSRSSTNFLIAIVSHVELWNRFNSSISLRLFWWASGRSQFCFNNCSWISCWSCRRRSSPCWARWISSFCDSIVSFNFWILLRS